MKTNLCILLLLSALAAPALAVELDNDLNGALDVALGGTNAPTKAGARANLDVEIGVDVQAHDEDLDDLADGILSKTKVQDSSNWDTAFSWGDHSLVGYLTSYTETDPIFSASDVAGVTSANIANWNSAFGWGDHSLVGYLTSYTETDPVVDTDSDAKADKAEGLEADAAGNIIIKMGDALGVNKVIFQDSTGTEIGSLDSDGAFTAKSHNSSAADGEYFLDVINGVAITATATDGRLAYYNGLYRKANGTDWVSEWLIENTAFAGNTETGITATAQTDGTIDLVVDADYGKDALEFVIDGGGSAINTGVKGYLKVPWGATITSQELVCDQSGSIVIDIWADSYTNFPPTAADTITASAKPTLSAAQKDQDATLTGWTTTVTEGYWYAFNVDSATTVTLCTISLQVSK